jgi:hypothetical protein
LCYYPSQRVARYALVSIVKVKYVTFDGFFENEGKEAFFGAVLSDLKGT